MAKANPFDYITSVSMTKVDMIRGGEDSNQAEKDYVPYLTNRQLSYFTDTILYANEMNMNASLPNLMQYEYYLHGINKKKRFSKWSKPDKSDDIELVANYFGYSKRRAEETLSLLTDENLDSIRKTLDPGG